MFEIIDIEEVSSDSGTVIKVIGVGGAGGNAVDHMIREGVNGVDFVAANTDAQALKRSGASIKLQLGKSGLGAGAKPEAGRVAAVEERERIAEALKGAHMAFITAGMGGGTGTGAAPIVAEVARELGILTVAVVTKPFGFEGKRMKVAEAGLAELQKQVDSLIVILNDKLMEVMGDDVSMDEAFRAADNVLRNAVGGIAEIINFPGLVNVDFEDVRTVMGEMGMAMMGSAYASGVDRARIAAEQAVACPLLEGIDLSGAKGVLVLITAAKGSFKLSESKAAMETIRAYASDQAHVVYGAAYDDALGDELRVTVVATGLSRQGAGRRQPITVLQGGLRTGTDNQFYAQAAVDGSSLGASRPAMGQASYDPAIVPKVWTSPRNIDRTHAAARVDALSSGGMDDFEIPAFLRKQAD